MSLDSAYCRETPTISATKEMAIKAINPNITVRSTDMMWRPRLPAKIANAVPGFTSIPSFTFRNWETYRERGVSPRVGSGGGNASRAHVGDALDASRAFGHYGSSSCAGRRLESRREHVPNNQWIALRPVSAICHMTLILKQETRTGWAPSTGAQTTSMYA